MDTTIKNVFETLNAIDVNGKTEKKGNLTYLSWAWAWAEVKKHYPDATYEIKKFGESQKPYLEDEHTGYMVFTEMTINGLTHEMWLPVMDFKNKAMPIGQATMFDVNKTIMRCLTKNIAMFGLGLYIYAGEDLPEQAKDDKASKDKALKDLNKAIKFAEIDPKELVAEASKRYGLSSSKEWSLQQVQELIDWVTTETIKKGTQL